MHYVVNSPAENVDAPAGAVEDVETASVFVVAAAAAAVAASALVQYWCCSLLLLLLLLLLLQLVLFDIF